MTNDDTNGNLIRQPTLSKPKTKTNSAVDLFGQIGGVGAIHGSTGNANLGGGVLSDNFNL